MEFSRPAALVCRRPSIGHAFIILPFLERIRPRILVVTLDKPGLDVCKHQITQKRKDQTAPFEIFHNKLLWLPPECMRLAAIMDKWSGYCPKPSGVQAATTIEFKLIGLMDVAAFYVISYTVWTKRLIVGPTAWLTFASTCFKLYQVKHRTKIFKLPQPLDDARNIHATRFALNSH